MSIFSLAMPNLYYICTYSKAIVILYIATYVAIYVAIICNGTEYTYLQMFVI